MSELRLYEQNDRSVYVLSPFRSRKGERLQPSTQLSIPNPLSARRRAFRLAMRKVWLNPDLNYFVTLTYKKQHENYQMILDDLKNFFTRRKVPYIATVERHKSGNFHVHCICGEIATTSLRPGKLSAVHWSKGFSDVKLLVDTDHSFRSELYVLKYITKSVPVGGRYVLSSRGLLSGVSKKVVPLDYSESVVAYSTFLANPRKIVSKIKLPTGRSASVVTLFLETPTTDSFVVENTTSRDVVFSTVDNQLSFDIL